MRNSLAILLFSIFLFGSTEAYQLLKVPALAVHFLQHAKDDPEMDFVSFLQMHYADKQVFGADWQQDMQLPFKTHEDAHAQLQLSYFPPASYLAIDQVAFSLPKKPAISNQFFEPGVYAVDIFQPPRTSLL